MAEPRRSGRQPKANPRYANDGWDKNILRKLRESSESSGSSPDEHPSDTGDDNQLETSSSLTDEPDDISMPSEASERYSDLETPGMDDDRVTLAGEDGSQARPHNPRPFAINTSEGARSRGIQFQRDPSKSAAYPGLFGPEVDDLSHVLQARDSWLQGRDATIPSRETLSTVIERLPKLPNTNAENIDASGSVAAGPADPFPQQLLDNQRLTPISEHELFEKHLLFHKPSHHLVLGPRGRQRMFNLEYLSALDFGKAWPKIPDEHIQGTRVDNGTPQRDDSYHEGWFLNVGEEVMCLAWGPSCGLVQYLAVAVHTTTVQRDVEHVADSDPSAFRPSPPYPSAIQIWAFVTHDIHEKGLRSLAMAHSPRLAVVFATNWGNIRRLKWSPSRPTNGDDTETADSFPGLLAVVSSDGHARVVAVTRPPVDEDGKETALRIEHAGLDVPPPQDTVFTTLSFASSTDLLLGTADGFVHLYDLSEAQNLDGPLQPCLRQQLHHTYIVGLSSASSGPRSTFIASASAAGDLALTDLRSPEQDHVVVSRTCFPNRDLVYLPFTNSFVAALDRSGNGQVDRNSTTLLVCHHIRQFPSLLKLAKLPHQSGAATALAGSKWHPCILAGNAKGQVLATNYLRKILPYRKTDHKKAVGAYLQKICEYDWRPLGTAEPDGEISLQEGDDSQNEDDIDIFHGRDVRPGMSCFHEGFKPEKIEVGNLVPNQNKTKETENEESSSGEAIFEEEQAVTAIDWNPHPAYAGMIAIGWGSGIIRIQDLSYEDG